MFKILLVEMDGFVGAISRYGIQMIFPHNPGSIPWGTFIANLAGCFTIGLIYGLAERNGIMSQEMRLFLAIGFCGSFTTFSAFAAENINLLQIGSSWVLLANALANPVLGVTAVYLGIAITKLG